MRRPDGTVRKRRKSSDIPGQAHELTFTCYHNLPMLGRNRTRQWLLQSLDQARRRWDLELWAYVIMPEHVHLLLLPRRDDYRISLILKAIKQPVAQRAVKYLKEQVGRVMPAFTPHPALHRAPQNGSAATPYYASLNHLLTTMRNSRSI